MGRTTRRGLDYSQYVSGDTINVLINERLTLLDIRTSPMTVPRKVYKMKAKHKKKRKRKRTKHTQGNGKVCKRGK